MCTASWLHDGSGYWLFFNRDERRDRQPAAPPRIRTVRGARFLAPVDGDYGGTWIAANELGIAVCLLNLYEADEAPRDTEPVSRGLLLNELVDARSRADVESRVREALLSRYRPFSMLTLAPREPVSVLVWDSRTLNVSETDENRAPFVSSAVRLTEATEARTETRARLAAEAGGLSRAVLEEFHSSHHPARGALSPCMHRDDASTVSESVIRVDADAVEFRYRAGAPCEQREVTTIRLPLQGRLAKGH
jgi:hypothetical protein